MKSSKFAGIVIVLILIAGGIYWFAQNFSWTNEKSLDYYLSNYEQDKVPYSYPYSELNLDKLVKVFSLGFDQCTASLDSEFCTPEMITEGSYLVGISLFSDANWSDGKSHEFYFEYNTEGGPLYYGPFQGNVKKLREEAVRQENYLQ